MKPQQSLIFGLVFALVILLFSSLYVVKEGQQAIVVRLGEVVLQDGTPRISTPGLHVKIPLIDHAKFFDVRILNLTSTPFDVLTSQQTFLNVDYFLKWRITNLALFYKSTNKGNMGRAEALLEQSINDIVRAEFGSHTSNQTISSQRDNIMEAIRMKANNLQKVKEMGVSIVDVRLKKVVLPDRVLESVFNRMASERKQFAENARAEGRKVAEGIRAAADKRVIVIEAQAKADGARIRAQGEQEAAQLYADTYQKDADFYSFYRSLEAYRESFSQTGDMLVLSPDSQFFKYFNGEGVPRRHATQ